MFFRAWVSKVACATSCGVGITPARAGGRPTSRTGQSRLPLAHYLRRVLTYSSASMKGFRFSRKSWRSRTAALTLCCSKKGDSTTWLAPFGHLGYVRSSKARRPGGLAIGLSIRTAGKDTSQETRFRLAPTASIVGKFILGGPHRGLATGTHTPPESLAHLSSGSQAPSPQRPTCALVRSTPKRRRKASCPTFHADSPGF